MKKCAHCNALMTPRDILGHEIDVCSTCKGVFLEAGELEVHKRGSLEFFDKENEGGNPDSHTALRYCPACETEEMQKRVFAYSSGITMDVCPVCGGIFLDAGELSAIDKYAEQESNPHLPLEVLELIKTQKAGIESRL